ncbi:hypothetical protein EIN_275180 [Entamoeba invadens IP1]|uniref:Uncharacterized protein n=1 Tax=Entamoeba invadens IP1 TaxID=370355 RepID=A0A0A1U7H3_ENTIV|nr:hypothetical protein EIN_275180 [Entamoeba invadens IP1]ELP87931.1 hypothetical protein EIN_275180 [Entamoeba invadens IP1]|eukprot:XP_004254702.1 hypothetical protein EIN_275180 [Entamoeba invadens IP1]
MVDFLEGEHCWCLFKTPAGELPWPSIVKRIVDQRTVILEILGTNKHLKVKTDWVQHGYKMSTRSVMSIGSKYTLDSEKFGALYDGVQQFLKEEKFTDTPLTPELEDFWIQQTLSMI